MNRNQFFVVTGFAASALALVIGVGLLVIATQFDGTRFAQLPLGLPLLGTGLVLFGLLGLCWLIFSKFHRLAPFVLTAMLIVGVAVGGWSLSLITSVASLQRNVSERVGVIGRLDEINESVTSLSVYECKASDVLAVISSCRGHLKGMLDRNELDQGVTNKIDLRLEQFKETADRVAAEPAMSVAIARGFSEAQSELISEVDSAIRIKRAELTRISQELAVRWQFISLLAALSGLGILVLAAIGLKQWNENQVRRTLESRLTEQRRRLEMMIRQLPAVSWTVDTELRFTSSEGAGLKNLGLEPNQVVGQSLFEYFQTNDRSFPAIAAHLRALQGEKMTFEQDWDEKVYASYIEPWYEGGTSIVGVIGVALDVTDQRRAEQSLRSAERLASIGTLAAGIAHEINNPLGAILGSAHAAMSGQKDPEKNVDVAECLHNIMFAAERAAQIVRNVRHFAGVGKSDQQTIDMNRAVLSAVELVESMGEIQKVTVEIERGYAETSVSANPFELEQVFVNILSNAIQASAEGDFVDVSIDSDQDTVKIQVRDHGCGMSTEQLAHIFDPFFTTRANSGGTGLGMSISHGIITRMGGALAVTSQIGKGTTVTVSLPKAPLAHTATGQGSTSATA